MNNEEFTAWRLGFAKAYSGSPWPEYANETITSQQSLVMGVLNVTPDSFSDAGHYLDLEQAWKRARLMIEQGADIIDIGGESSRPGATAVSCDEELARVIPIIERIRSISDICISIDTCKADVMVAAVSAGASIINDIKGLQGEGAIAAVAQMNVPVCLMHMHGSPETMQNNPHYSQDMLLEINQFFHQRIEACEHAGIQRNRLILDPGFGFGKSVEQNLRLLKRLAEFKQHKLPVLLGVSRKNTLGVVLNQSIMNRMNGGLATAVFAIMHGVNIVRTHDVIETTQALHMIDAIVNAY